MRFISLQLTLLSLHPVDRVILLHLNGLQLLASKSDAVDDLGAHFN